jgi:glycogen(starch) synthase
MSRHQYYRSGIRLETLLVCRRFAPAPGGVESQVAKIAERLAARGHSVTVCTTDLYSDVPFRRLSERTSNSRRAYRLSTHTAVPVPFRSSHGTSLSPAMILKAFRKNSFDIVHCQGLNLATVLPSLLTRQMGPCKSVCTTHLDPSVLSSRFSISLLKRFDGLVALTMIEKARLMQLGLKESNIKVIPDGLDLDTFRNLPPRYLFRRRLGIKGRMILYAGRIDATDKGLADLIQATALLQQRIGKCTLVLAGPDWGSAASLRNLARERNVSAIFAGNLSQTELKQALVACDAFVMPSRVEAFGLSIVEAMLCRAPVVATCVGGIPTIVSNEETGLLTPPKDPSALSDAIIRLLLDRRFSNQLTSNAGEFALQFSIDGTVEKLINFYRELKG